MVSDIDLVEYWNFLRLPYVEFYHHVDWGSTDFDNEAPTGEMLGIHCGFGNHLLVGYYKGAGAVRQVLRVESDIIFPSHRSRAIVL